MKYCISFLFLLASVLSCQPIVVDEEDNEKPAPPPEVEAGDSLDTGAEGVITVDSLLNIPVASDGADEDGGITCRLRAYIVGYVAGTTINSARFECPDRANTNLLIADRPTERDIARCAAVRLETGGNESPREVFNLNTHPELMYRRIGIVGIVDAYFRRPGITHIYSYSIYPESTDNPENPLPPEGPDAPDTPDNPEDPAAPDTLAPTIDRDTLHSSAVPGDSVQYAKGEQGRHRRRN